MQVNITHEHILILDENFHKAFCNEIESKMQTNDKGEKGIRISNWMFVERIKEQFFVMEPDPSNILLLHIESTSVEMQQTLLE